MDESFLNKIKKLTKHQQIYLEIRNKCHLLSIKFRKIGRNLDIIRREKVANFSSKIDKILKKIQLNRMFKNTLQSAQGTPPSPSLRILCTKISSFFFYLRGTQTVDRLTDKP